MNILVLDSLINQNVSPEVFKMLRREYNTLSSEEYKETHNIFAYLKNKGLKKFQDINIWKFRLNDEYRVFYSFGKYFSSIPKSEKDSIVLLWCCTDHDRQGEEAKSKNFFIRKKYETISKLVENINECLGDDTNGFGEVSEENIKTTYELIQYAFNQRNIYRIFKENEKYTKPLDELELGLTEDQEIIYSSFINKAIINKATPTLVLGGAGTGKTFIAERILREYLIACEDTHSIYFTQSRELLNRVRNNVSNLLHDNDVVEDKTNNKLIYRTSSVLFRDLNEYCMSILKLDDTRLVRTDEFVNDFIAHSDVAKKICKDYKLDPTEVWTEIRGVIKGSMKDDWTRPGIITQDQFHRFCEENGCINKSLDYYVKKGFVGRDGKQIRWIKTAKEMKDESKKANRNARAFSFLAEKCFFDKEKNGLTEEEYLELPDDYTTNDANSRKAIYLIYTEYEKYLSNNDLFDDTDLMLKLYGSLSNNIKKSLVVADEVQDYTEIQLFIINQICSNNIFYCGDANQNVNPTLFRERKLKSLHADMELKTETLTCSYRCTKPVVEITNKMMSACKKIVGAGKGVSSQIAESERYGEIPFRLEYSDQNIKRICEEISSAANAFILVPNNNTKQHLIDLFGKDQYIKNGYSFIFTVPEIKGMEIEYVLCYNLFGEFYSIWNRLFSPENFKHRTQFRYYFNMFNVASTRSQAYLGFIDNKICQAIENTINLQKVSHFDINMLFLDKLKRDSASFIKTAQDFEKNGRYDDAISYYKRAGKCSEDIIRCFAKNKEAKREYEKATAYYLLCDKKPEAESLMSKINKKSTHFVIADFILNKKEASKSTLNKYGSYVDIFNSIYDELEYAPEESRDLLLLDLKKVIIELTENKISSLRKIGAIDGGI